MPTLKFIRIAVISLFAAATTVSSATAMVVGTFSGSRAGVEGLFNLFNGTLMDSARAALAGDGHTLVNLDAGISAASLAGIGTVYLPTPIFGPPPAILSNAEATALFNFVVAGGNLIVQGDTPNFGPAYNNVAAQFGVQFNPDLSLNGYGFTTTGVVGLTGTLAGLTNGPYGIATSVNSDSSGQVLPGSSPGLSLLDTPRGGSFLYVLGPETGFAGAGRVIFLTDVNSFDDPENTNGYAQGDGAILWRNMFGFVSPDVSAVPIPAALPLFASGLCVIGLIARRRKRQARAAA